MDLLIERANETPTILEYLNKRLNVFMLQSRVSNNLKSSARIVK